MSNRHLRWVLVAWLVLGVAVGVSVALLRRPETATAICRLGATALGRELHLDVTFESCTLDPLTAGLRVRGLRAVNPKARERDQVSVDVIELRLRPLQALAGGLQIERLDLQGLKVLWAIGDKPDPKPKSSVPMACWVGILKLVHVESLSVRDASLDMAFPGGRAAMPQVTLASELSHGVYRLRLAAQGQAELTARSPRRSTAVSLGIDMDLDVPHDRAVVDGAGLRTEGLDFAVSGSIEQLCNPEPDLKGTLRASVADLAALTTLKLPALSGTVELAAAYRSHPNAISGTLGVADLEIAGTKFPPLSLKVSGTNQRVHIDALHADLDPKATLEVRGTLELKGRLPIDLEVEVRNGSFARVLDLAQMKHSWVDFRANALSHLSGHVLGGFTLGGNVSADVSNVVVDDRGWDLPGHHQRMLTVFPVVHLQSDVHIDAEGVHFQRAHLKSPLSEANVDVLAHYDSRRGLTLRTDFPHLDLSELRQIAGLDWDGRGALFGTVEGPYDDMTVKATVAFEDFALMHVDYGAVSGAITAPIRQQLLLFPSLSGQRGRTAYRAAGQLDFKGDNLLDLKLEIPAGKLSDLFGAVEALQPVMSDLRQDITGEVAGYAEIQGPAGHPDASVVLSFGNFEVFGRRFHAGTLTASVARWNDVTIDSFHANAGGGEVVAQGRLAGTGELAITVQAKGLPLDKLLWPEGEPSARGALGAVFELGGRLDAPKPAGTFTLEDLEIFDIPLGSARGRLSTEGSTLSVSGTAGDEVTVQGAAKLIERGPFHATFVANTHHLERYLAPHFESPLGGAVDGALELTGSLLDAGQASGSFTIDHLVLTDRRLRIESTGAVHLGLAAGALDLAPTTLSAPGGKVSAAGTLSSEGQLNGSLRADLDLRSLEGLVPKVERLSGQLQLQASVRGSAESPAVVGSARIAQGQFTWQGLPLLFNRIEGSAEFSQRKLLLSTVRGELNGGPVEIGGEILLSKFSFSHYDLNGTLRDVLMRIPTSLPSRVSGRLQLQGDPDRDLRLSGRLDVGWARYTRNFDLETLIESFRTERPQDLAAVRNEGVPLRLDIQLHGDGDLRVENDLAHLRLLGDLKLTGSSDSPGLIGTVSTRNGFVDFRGYRYQVSQAVFSFADAESIVPGFEISADTDARQYRVFVHAFGTPRDYQIQLSSQPSLSEEDVLKLLTIGVTSQDSVSNASTAGTAGYLGDVLWNISGLHDQVRRFIPRNDLIKDFSFNLGSAFIEATGQVEPVAQIESRVLTDRLRLRAQVPLSEATGKRAQAEYQLNEHLSVQGEWNNDYADYNIGDFGLDLRARWEFGD